jgi:hypothetical protein
MTGAALISNMLYAPQSHHAPLPFYQFHDEGSLIFGIERALTGSIRDSWAGSLEGQIRCAHLPQHRAGQLVDFIERNRR